MGRGCQQAVPVLEWQSWVKGSRSQAEPEQGSEPRVFQAVFKVLSRYAALSGSTVFGLSGFPPQFGCTASVLEGSFSCSDR